MGAATAPSFAVAWRCATNSALGRHVQWDQGALHGSFVAQPCCGCACLALELVVGEVDAAGAQRQAVGHRGGALGEPRVSELALVTPP